MKQGALTKGKYQCPKGLYPDCLGFNQTGKSLCIFLHIKDTDYYSVTRLGNLLDCDQVFKAFGNN